MCHAVSKKSRSMPAAKFPPALATDCHTHVAGDPLRYPMVSPRAYTPETASPDDMRAMMGRVGTQRIVLVQMSVFGTDNSCMLDGISALGDRARGVAQVDEQTSGPELDRMNSCGVRGIRVNLNTTGLNDPDIARNRLSLAAEKCARHGWHLQLFTTAKVIVEVGDVLKGLPVPVVLDHFGLLPVIDRNGEGETVVRDLLARGQGWVKISGTYRLDRPEAKGEIAALARDLYRTNPDNIVWGSDWPHAPHHNNVAQANPPTRPYQDIDPRDMLATVEAWFESDEDRKRILVDNPARLYGFA
jgi:predicted TIM-barrel fold metal-dependent hydrolase